MSDKEQPPQTPPQNTTPQVTTTGESVGGGHTSGYVTQEQHAALADKQKSDRDLLMIIMGGVVIFVVISFFIELVNLHIDYAQDKSLAEQNNEIIKDYSDQILQLNNKIQSLSTQLQLLEAKNPYLK